MLHGVKYSIFVFVIIFLFFCNSVKFKLKIYESTRLIANYRFIIKKSVIKLNTCYLLLVFFQFVSITVVFKPFFTVAHFALHTMTPFFVISNF